MKIIVLGVLAFLLALTLGCNVSAQSGTGSTVINATVSEVWALNLSLKHPEIIVPEDYYFYENLTVLQTGYQNISVYLNKSDTNDFVKFVNETQNGTYYQDDYTLYVPANTDENMTLRVYVPAGMGYDGGTYNVPIYAYSLDDYRSNSTTLKIHVNTTNPIDDIEIISINPSSLYSGESLTVNISIHKIYPTETTDIQICYCINPNPTYQCGPAYNNYGCEWKAITEWLNYTKNVIVGESPGNYYFFVAVKYPGDEDIKRAISPGFLVKQVPGPPSGDGGAPGFVAAPQPELTITAPDYLDAAPGERVVFDVEIENTGSADAPNTSLDIYGIPEEWVLVTPYTQDIGVGESKHYSVSIFLPVDVREQIYSMSLVGKSGTEESIRIVTFTVAMTLKKQAQFLLDEARSKGKEAERIVGQAEDLGMDVTGPENTRISTNAMLEETQRLFDSGNYKESVEKAKQTIDGYKSVIDSVKDIVGEAFLSLLDRVRTELTNIEELTEEKDVVDSIKEKIEQGATLQREKRTIEAYKTLLEAKRLLDQLRGKIFFMELTQNTVVIAIMVVIVVAILMVVFYKKRMSRFVKTMRIEEHKKRLSSLFKKKVIRPGETRGKPKIDKEKIDEIRRLLEIGEALMDTDVVGTKEAYTKARNIYNSLSPEEKRVVSDDIIRLTRLYNKIVKRAR
jgi:hypothetical protein